MYRCLDCKTVYKDKVEFCECGNNTFEEIVVPSQPKKEEQPPTQPKQEAVKEIASRKIVSFNEIVSYVVFGVCCVASVLVLISGPAPEQKSEQKLDKKEPIVEKPVQKAIPSIDEIWNDTPSYTVSSNVSIETYKSDLKDLLAQNFTLAKFDGDGSCEIEFTIDSVGRVSNKKLIKNTANKPLTAAAKKMLKDIKRVTPPPKDFYNTTFRLELIEYNNEYQFRFVN